MTRSTATAAKPAAPAAALNPSLRPAMMRAATTRHANPASAAAAAKAARARKLQAETA